MYKNIKILIFLILVTICFSACKPDVVELIETTLPTLSKNNDGNVVSKEKVVTPTIDLEQLIIESVEESIAKEADSISKVLSKETTKPVNESKIAESIIEESESTETISKESTAKESESKASIINENNISESTAIASAESETLPLFDQMFDEDDRIYHGTEKVDTDNWRYGMTPCEWVYIEPGIQLISNYKPNTSKVYVANGKTRVSSGVKGCFLPVFTKCDMMSNDFEGRFYVFSDYSSATPEEMAFSNSLKTVKYKGLTIEDILKMKFDVTRTQNGLLIVNGEYINIVYLTDLDNILNEK